MTVDMSAGQLDADSIVGCCAPIGADTLSDAEANATAQLFRALGDPARVRILNVLATSEEPVCVCHLVEPLGLTQPTVSHHLKTLTDVGLLDRRQRGKWAFFSLKPGAAARLASLLDFNGR
jgi:ArsR family transcriptional regulator, arsenate/arsenite/antimonite-responsive transcriptional repressor